MILLVLLALLALTGAVYAIGRLAGFIPGFGFTSDAGAASVLAAPVEADSGGITLRLENAVSDSSKLWVEMTTTGSIDGLHFPQAFLLLPDGEKIESQMGSGGDTDQGGARLEFTFAPLVGAPGAVSLQVENLDGQSFSLPFALRPARPEEMLLSGPAEAALPQGESRDGLSLALEHVAASSDKTVLQVSLHYDYPNTWVNTEWNVILSDTAGRVYPMTDVTPDTLDRGSTRIYQTVPFSGTEQLMLSLVAMPQSDSLPVFEDFSAQSATFPFDPGPDAQIGQTWNLDQTVKLGRFTLHAVRAALVAGTGPGLRVRGGSGSRRHDGLLF